MTLVHGTCIAIGGSAVLFRGAPGAGKSDLALRLLARPRPKAWLVSDDQVELHRKDGCLWASAPASIAGLLEVRGVGLTRWPALTATRLRLVLDLCQPDQVPRLPEAGQCTIDGVELPLYPCAPFEASAPDKVVLLLRALDEDMLRS